MKTPSLKKLALNSPSLLVLCCLLTAAALPARALDITGSPLQLNGSGVRHLAGSGLYRASLYLDKKLAAPADIFGNPGAKQLRVVMLRDASAAEMGDLLARGMVANASDDELSRLVPALFSIGEMFGDQKKLLAGDSFLIDWQPGKAMVISIYSGATAGQGTARVQSFTQPELFGVMLRLWLGATPADPGLKNALLGQAI
jgi:Chalcone isomerase-like